MKPIQEYVPVHTLNITKKHSQALLPPRIKKLFRVLKLNTQSGKLIGMTALWYLSPWDTGWAEGILPLVRYH